MNLLMFIKLNFYPDKSFKQLNFVISRNLPTLRLVKGRHQISLPVVRGFIKYNIEPMDAASKTPEPLLFNPLKHYLPYIREFIDNHVADSTGPGLKALTREIRHIGTCVMDIYSGEISTDEIFGEIRSFLKTSGLQSKELFMNWAGPGHNDFRIVTLSDSSLWMLNYPDHPSPYVHIFPARSSPYTFRVKANTLKSAILYIIVIGRDYVSEDDLNGARALAGLSPVREVTDAEAVTEMIEILRK